MTLFGQRIIYILNKKEVSKMVDYVPTIVFCVLALAIILLLSREIVCWYLKINERIKLLKDVIEGLKY